MSSGSNGKSTALQAARTEARLSLVDQAQLALAASDGEIKDQYGNPVNKDWVVQRLVCASEHADKTSDEISALKAVGKAIGVFDDNDSGKGRERRIYADLFGELLAAALSGRKEPPPTPVKSERVSVRDELLIPAEAESG